MVEKSDYGTKMDDVILESLKPQVEEIKKKLASGGGLSHEDIITLTIYTQGNHVNHVDMRMDALCADFSTLREDFSALRAGFAGLEGKVESKIAGLETKIERVRAEFSKQTATIGGICAAAVAIATVISNILK